MLRRLDPLQLLLGLIVIAAAVIVGQRMEVKTDVSAFMPTGGQPLVAEAVRQMADSELSRTMVLMIAGRDAEDTLRASRSFEAAMRADPVLAGGLQSLSAGPPTGTERAIFDLYHPRRFSLLASSADEVPDLLSDAELSRAAAGLKERLAQPMSPLISRLSPSDPLLITTRLFDRMQESEGRSLTVRDGRFVTADGTWAVLFATTRARAFDSGAQAPVVAAVARAFNTVNARAGGRLRLEQGAVNRVAVRTEQTIRGDIERVSALSVVSLLVVLLSLFRGLRLVGLASIPIGVGVLGGIAACLVVFGSVHGITLAFGASLIGVAIDYVIHLYAHHAVAPSPQGASHTLDALWPSLLTGAVTTLVGFIALSFGGFPGLQQVSLFASVGILLSLLTTRAVLPPLLPRKIQPVAFRVLVTEALYSLLCKLRRKRRALWALPAVALAFSAWGLPQLRLDSNLISMAQVDDGIAREEAAVRDRVARFDQTRFVLATGQDEEEALQTNDGVASALQVAVSEGELSDFRSLSALLRSARTQREVSEAVREQLGDGGRLLAAFEAEGFRSEAFSPFKRDLQAPMPPPLAYDDLAESPLAGAVQSFRITLNERPAFLTFLQQVHDAEGLSRRLANIDGAIFVDQGRLLRDTYAAYQQATAELIGVGLVMVLLILVGRYRSPRRVLAASGPALLGAGVTLSALAVFGHSLNLVSLTALLMVVSMGVDYGVFLVDSEALGKDHESAALLSVSMAALSTILGFGWLALSKHPLLSSIGLTACVGVASCLILSPATLAIVGEHRDP